MDVDVDVNSVLSTEVFKLKSQQNVWFSFSGKVDGTG